MQLGDVGTAPTRAPTLGSPPISKLLVLTIVGFGMDRANAQVLAEERHGGVLALCTLAGHGAARGDL